MNITSPQNRRRIIYVDHIIQKWLLIALVVLETLLIGLAIWALYRALSEIIDENIYRIHLSEDTATVPRFLGEGLKIIIGVGVVNVLALIAADRIWAAYVRGILHSLGKLMQASQELDFSEQQGIRSNHSVLEQALSWRQFEASRLNALRDTIRTLPADLPATLQERAKLAAQLREIQGNGNTQG